MISKAVAAGRWNKVNQFKKILEIIQSTNNPLPTYHSNVEPHFSPFTISPPDCVF